MPLDKCGATTRSGQKCGRPAGWGTPTPGAGPCKLHGGCTPSVQSGSQRVIARREMTKLGITWQEAQGDHRPIDPREALATELFRTHVNVAVLEHLVAELGFDIHGELYHADGERTGRAAPHVLVTMYNAERKHLVDVSAAAHRAGVEERRTQLEQEKALLIVEVLKLAIDKVPGLTVEQRRAFMTAAAEAMRRLSTGGID